MVKNLPAMAGDLGSVPELERSPREGNSYPLQCSDLENIKGKGAWRATVLGVAKSWTWLSNFHISGLQPTRLLCPWDSRKQYWSGLLFPSLGDLPDPGIEAPFPALAGRFFTTELPGEPLRVARLNLNGVVKWFLITHFLPHHKSLLSLTLEELKLMVFQSLEMGLVTLKQLSQIGRSLGKKMLTMLALG